MTREILMIAGPNGAGKTTMTLELISGKTMLYEFINADEIARGLAPMNPESVAISASKLMLGRLKELLEAKKNFAFETTASGTNYIKYLKDAKSKGYQISLTFLWLSSPEQAVQRVMQRVKQGGHHVPEEVIQRRYASGQKNFLKHYFPLADRVLVLDNSSETKAKKVIAIKNLDGRLEIKDTVIWNKIEKVAHG